MLPIIDESLSPDFMVTFHRCFSTRVLHCQWCTKINCSERATLPKRSFHTSSQCLKWMWKETRITAHSFTWLVGVHVHLRPTLISGWSFLLSTTKALFIRFEWSVICAVLQRSKVKVECTLETWEVPRSYLVDYASASFLQYAFEEFISPVVFCTSSTSVISLNNPVWFCELCFASNFYRWILRS